MCSGRTPATSSSVCFLHDARFMSAHGLPCGVAGSTNKAEFHTLTMTGHLGRHLCVGNQQPCPCAHFCWLGTCAADMPATFVPQTVFPRIFATLCLLDNCFLVSSVIMIIGMWVCCSIAAVFPPVLACEPAA